LSAALKPRLPVALQGPGVKDREEEYGKADDENPAINSLLIDKHQIVIYARVKQVCDFRETMKDAQHHD
jgi:hypothetical protein